MVELKNGETYNGELINCDSWMNLTLKQVVQLLAHGDKFCQLPEVYIRGIHIKYLRLPEEIMDMAKEQNLINMEQRNRNNKRRGFNNGGNQGHNRRYNQQGGRGGYNNRRYNQQGQGHHQGGHHGQGHHGQQGHGQHNHSHSHSQGHQQHQQV